MWQIIGQSRAVSLLQQSLAAERIAHAYLFIGPQHVGKMTLALHFAQALNCEADEPPCRECAPCQKIAAGNHADVQIIGLARNGDAAEATLIGIDQIKQIQHSANLPTFEGKSKVFIIENAELLSTEAANCLLKTLEEPADRVTFILLTENDRLLPATVVSRCQCLNLTPISITEEAEALVDAHSIEPERARLLAGISHGCPGWAIMVNGDDSLLEQRNKELEVLLDIINADFEKRFNYAAQLASRFSQNRTAVYDVMNLWLNYWRDLMLVKLACQDFVSNIDHTSRLFELAGEYNLVQIKDFIHSIRMAMGNLKKNVNARLALEVLMLDIPRRKGGGEGNPKDRISVTYG